MLYLCTVVGLRIGSALAVALVLRSKASNCTSMTVEAEESMWNLTRWGEDLSVLIGQGSLSEQSGCSGHPSLSFLSLSPMHISHCACLVIYYLLLGTYVLSWYSTTHPTTPFSVHPLRRIVSNPGNIRPPIAS